MPNFTLFIYLVIYKILAGDAKHWNRKVIQRWKRKIRNIRKEGRKSLEESPNQHLNLHPPNFTLEIYLLWYSESYIDWEVGL